MLHFIAYCSCHPGRTDAALRMQVTDSIGQLTGLTSLIFARCPLEELSSSVSRLQNLRELKLEGSFFPEVNYDLC